MSVPTVLDERVRPERSAFDVPSPRGCRVASTESTLRPEWRNGSSRLPGGAPWAHHLRMAAHEKGQDVKTLRDGQTRD